MDEATWAVVLPVKRLHVAKSRLRGALPGVPHESLALALAQDTARAALACPPVAEVVAVTDDPTVGRALARLGARVVPDDPRDGLNAAFAHGAAAAGAGRPVAALAADLPALRPEELAAALSAAATNAGRARSFVADAPGTGTVLLAAPPGTALDPRFGVGSAEAHRRSGALPMAGHWPTLRRDVDTAADLAVAALLGLGPETEALTGGIHARNCRDLRPADAVRDCAAG
ncbi:2-phospho-L-lactate guanylyltransferase [Micromonospora sp. CPCC 206061]|uniref:2-phospho-L-lactate guanylyltransferase n=1 Tax=Micromonospora sp. CPCC 206061 TaxID=3122410 RepID=UPI002FF0FDF0